MDPLSFYGATALRNPVFELRKPRSVGCFEAGACAGNNVLEVPSLLVRMLIQRFKLDRYSIFDLCGATVLFFVEPRQQVRFDRLLEKIGNFLRIDFRDCPLPFSGTGKAAADHTLSEPWVEDAAGLKIGEPIAENP